MSGANALSRRLRVGGGLHDISVLFQEPTQELHVHLVVVQTITGVLRPDSVLRKRSSR